MDLSMENQNVVGFEKPNFVGFTLQKERHLRARWTAFLTEVLVDLMVDQVRLGYRKNNSFNRTAWNRICDGFHKKTGLTWEKDQLKNRYSVLRRQYSLVKRLLDRGDVSWDESTGHFIANNEAWTDVEGHPEAENIKFNGCPIYKQLCSIFSESTTHGKCDPSAEIEGGIPSSLYHREPLSVIQGEILSVFDDEDNNMAYDQELLPGTHGSIAMRKRGRKCVDGSIAEAIQEMAASSKLATAAINHCNEKYSIANCIKELDEMQIVEQEVYLAALDLFNNPNARETFLSLKGNKRVIWLLRKCSVPSTILGY